VARAPRPITRAAAGGNAAGADTARVYAAAAPRGYAARVRPLVAITQRLRAADGGGRAVLELDPAYAQAIEAAGGLPFHLPLLADPGELLARADGLVLPGGPDFLPPPPGRAGVRFDAIDPRQLAADRAALAAAAARGIPVLGICYGMQLLALERGGALHFHLPADLPAAGEHQRADGDARHALRVEPGSLLARLLGGGRAVVNSSHHQAVSDPGPELGICARAEDGVIEAVEDRSAAFCLGVQWHPERMDEAHRRALFGGFVAACARR
jgi:putative glutamine amidotransferase